MSHTCSASELIRRDVVRVVLERQRSRAGPVSSFLLQALSCARHGVRGDPPFLVYVARGTLNAGLVKGSSSSLVVKVPFEIIDGLSRAVKPPVVWSEGNTPGPVSGGHLLYGAIRRHDLGRDP
jgi:hypothetical protein